MTRSRWSALVDHALEATIAGSFTNIGYRVRKKMAHQSDEWEPLPEHAMQNRTVVLTGGTSGIGEATTLALARAGARVTIVARNPAKAEHACERINAIVGLPTVDFVVADMGDLAAVRRAAREIKERHAIIDVLIHNAGALDDAYRRSPQGLEQTIASHVVGPYLLTMELRAYLARSEGARVLWVSSGGMYSEPLSVDGLDMPEASYDGVVAYARAKRAQVVLTELLADTLAADQIHVHSMHPGWADTPGVARSLPTFQKLLGPVLRTPEQGADTLVWLAASRGLPATQTGKFWHDRAIRPTHKLARTRTADTPSERSKLLAWVEKQAARNLA